MSDVDLAKIFRHMLLGVAHTHGVGIVHRDIKPDNFLWGGPGNKTLKLCDYGLAVMMPQKGKLHGVFGQGLSEAIGSCDTRHGALHGARDASERGLRLPGGRLVHRRLCSPRAAPGARLRGLSAGLRQLPLLPAGGQRARDEEGDHRRQSALEVPIAKPKPERSPKFLGTLRRCARCGAGPVTGRRTCKSLTSYREKLGVPAGWQYYKTHLSIDVFLLRD